MGKDRHLKLQNLQNAYPFICICSLIMLFGMIYLGLYQNERFPLSFLASNRITVYAGSLLTAGIFFLLLRLVFMFIPLKSVSRILNCSLNEKSAAVLTAVIYGITAILLLHRRFYAEFTEYPQRDIPLKAFHLVPAPAAILMLLFVSILLFSVFRSAQNGRISSVLTWTAYLFTFVFIFYSLYYWTIDKDSGFDVHHGAAYIQTIYNALYLVPYELTTVGNYGHYGIFYALIIRLFKLPSEAVFVLIGIAGIITAACSIYIIRALVKNPGLRIISAVSLAVPQALVCLPNYWMNYPHRVLFPMVVSAWIVFALRKTGRNRRIPAYFLLASYILSALAVVWNTETGLYCLICTAAAAVFRDWQKYDWYHPRMILRYLIHITVCILSLAGAIGIVYGWNFYCCHKKGLPMVFSLKDFFFPYAIIESFIGRGFQANAMFGNHAWVYVIILFMGTLFYVLKQTTFFREPREYFSDDHPAAGMLALLGLMQFSLYFEHASYDKLSTCLIPAVILMAYFAEKPVLQPFGFPARIRKTSAELLKQTFASVSCIILVVLSAEVLTMGSAELGLHMYLSHGKSNIHHLASLYNEVVPPDTFSIGSCVDVLNYKLRQEPGGHYRDLSDMYVGGSQVPEKIVADVLERDQFAVWDMGNREPDLVKRILAADPGYTVIREIILGGYPLRLYSR